MQIIRKLVKIALPAGLIFCAETLPTHCIDNYASVMHKKYPLPQKVGVIGHIALFVPFSELDTD